MEITHLRHNEIDRIKWDETVATSKCDLPYAYTWWLDAVSPGWEALISEGYRYIMPLPLKEKKGLKYLIHPVWVQQLGIYSAEETTKEIFEQFRKNIPYLVYDFNINYTNYYDSNKIGKKTNLIVRCDRDIDEIRKEYSSNTRRNIKKARKQGLEIRETEKETMIEMWKNHNIASTPLHHTAIVKLIDAAIKARGRFKAHIYGVYEDEKIIASLFGIETRSRFIYLIPVSDKRGKEVSAMFMMVDEIIEKICCKKQIKFDCEGSMIPGVARFYRGFGAEEERYGVIRRCHPTWLVKLLHK